MSVFSSYQIPPPKNWQDFEALCADLWRERWADNDLQRNGRSGQPQHGVDIVGRLPEGGLGGIQCKCTDAASVLSHEVVAAEVERAKQFTPPLARYLIATTGRKDVHLEQLCRTLSEEHARESLFSVVHFGWDDIVALLEAFPAVAGRHFPFLQHAQAVLHLDNDNNGIGRHWQHLRYSFIRQEYIHPLIIKELLGWLSDAHETIVSVDLASGNTSNRFFGDYPLTSFLLEYGFESKRMKGSSRTGTWEREHPASMFFIAARTAAARAPSTPSCFLCYRLITVSRVNQEPFQCANASC